MLGLQHTFNQNTGLFYFEYIFINICLKPDTGGTLKVVRHCIVPPDSIFGHSLCFPPGDVFLNKHVVH